MAWVRIDDRAMSHPKIIGLTDKAFRLWVWGLSYAQAHLTNGFLPAESLQTGSLKSSGALLERGLWELAANGKGFQIHDFTDWNDTRDRVKERQAAAEAERIATRERMARWRATKKEKQECDAVTVTSPVTSQIRNSDALNQTKPNQTKVLPKEQEVRSDAVTARSKRPIFSGQRLTVFEWMLDDCCRTLGNYLQQFDLHEWFFSLDAMAVERGLVIPKRDGGEWLQAQLLTEARRRGIPLRLATAEAPKDYEADTRAQADAALALLHKRHA